MAETTKKTPWPVAAALATGITLGGLGANTAVQNSPEYAAGKVSVETRRAVSAAVTSGADTGIVDVQSGKQIANGMLETEYANGSIVELVERVDGVDRVIMARRYVSPDGILVGRSSVQWFVSDQPKRK